MSTNEISREEALRQQKAIEKLAEQYRNDLHRKLDSQAVRKWCVEQANLPNSRMTAQEIFEFVTAPLRQE